VLEDNDIFSNALAGVEIRSGADPLLEGNRVHTQSQSGVLCLDNGRGMLKGNDIWGNAMAGVEVTTGAQPVLGPANRIHDGQRCALQHFWSILLGVCLEERHPVAAGAIFPSFFLCLDSSLSCLLAFLSPDNFIICSPLAIKQNQQRRRLHSHWRRWRHQRQHDRGQRTGGH
jgi:hypothetical protein